MNNILQPKVNNTNIFYRFINSKKQIRSGIGPLKDSDGKLATDAKSMASTRNSYFRSVFNDTSAGGNVAPYDIVDYGNVANPVNTVE